jgi:ppGpp synthetase/RelA/SpoT-type nucleotidyltranferase
MVWTKPEGYSRKKVDTAGKILIKKFKEVEDAKEKEAFEIFHNWRASHAYPMHIIMLTLKNISKNINSGAICVQRLKRVKSIIGKLERYSSQLSQIQDIGGCRVVVPDVKSAKKIAELYIKSNQRHKRVKSRERNYINKPKSDGYRSIHLVYKYYSINKVGKLFNNKLIEIQIRSKIQHIWATAVETVDIFTGQTLKFGSGNKKWEDFFRLISSAFATIEECPTVDNTPTNEKELYSEIKNLAKELKVLEKMRAWRSSMKHLEDKKDSLFLLRLDIGKKQIYISQYKNNENGMKNATEDYSKEEKKYKNNDNCDVVLIWAENLKDLKKAYPNYFADTQEFIFYLQKIINKKY